MKFVLPAGMVEQRTVSIAKAWKDGRSIAFWRLPQRSACGDRNKSTRGEWQWRQSDERLLAKGSWMLQRA